MKASRWLIGRRVAVLSLALWLTGCVVAPAGYVGEVPAYGPVVMVAPPAPHVEVIGAPPVAGQIWIGGYWGWSGGRHTWVPGRWAAPRPGYTWAPPHWSHEGQGWRFRQGYWARH